MLMASISNHLRSVYFSQPLCAERNKNAQVKANTNIEDGGFKIVLNLNNKKMGYEKANTCMVRHSNLPGGA